VIYFFITNILITFAVRILRMKQKTLILLFAIAVFTSCGEYQKILKSTDPDFKYKKAVEYFEKKDFMRATTLFDEVTSYYKGTETSELILNYLANCYLGQKDNLTAVEYFKTYVKTYPKGKFTIDSKFMIGYCYYLDSPDTRLDQTITQDAIAAFQEFVDVYPESERVPEAMKLLDEMNDKIAQKYYLNSKLYYNLGNYMGNNYESAVITAQNALKRFPSTIHREELSMLILQAKYEQAVQSVVEKRLDRYRAAIDEYYNYINEYPEGKMRKQADKIFNESKKIVND